MTIRQLKRLCWSISALLAAGTVGLFVLAMVIPLDVSRVPVDESATVTSRAVNRVVQPLTMMDFEPLLNGRLRRPPQVAAPTPQPVAEAPPPPPVQAAPEMKLLGTVTENKNSMAIIQAGDETQNLKVGEKIKDAEVTEITEGVAVLKRSGGEVLTLRVPLPPG